LHRNRRSVGAHEDPEPSVEELKRELAEAYQRAWETAEILRVISSSPTVIERVLDVLVSIRCEEASVPGLRPRDFITAANQRMHRPLTERNPRAHLRTARRKWRTEVLRTQRPATR